LTFVEPCLGRTPEIIHLSHACIAVSGSVGLELLYRAKPSVIVYRVNSFVRTVTPWFLKIPFISLVNLLAGKELFPEFLTDKCEAQAVSEHVLRWLAEPLEYQRIKAELIQLRGRVAEPGACDRTAQYVMDALGRKPLLRTGRAA